MDRVADHYATLKVAPEADAAAIRRAYRAAMKSQHPDVNRGADANASAAAINAAYACLCDSRRRAAYDLSRRTAPDEQQNPFERAMRENHPPAGWRFDETLFEAAFAPATRKLQFVSVGLAILLTAATFFATAWVSDLADPRSPSSQPALADTRD